MTNNKQTERNSTQELDYKMRRSFSWDRAFFTSDGFLAPEELSTMIEGGRNDAKHELECLEAKIFQELEASTRKYASNGSGGSLGNNVKSLVRKGMSSKNGKGNADSPSKTPPAITTKIKVSLVNTRIPCSSPASPVSPGSKNGKADVDSRLKTPSVITSVNKLGSVNMRISRISPASPVVSPRSSGSSSSSSAFSINQRPKWNGSVRCGSLVNNEKLVATNGRRNDDRKSSKPAVDLMPKSQTSNSSKIKPAPESSFSSTKPTYRKHPTGHINGSNATKLTSIKTVATANTGLKPKSPKTTTPKKQSKGLESITVISPEILDLKGKLFALKMELNIHKDRCNKLIRVESGKPMCF